MFKNYLKIAWSSLKHRKGFAIINGLGLALGIWCTLTIIIWIRDEMGWNTYPGHGDRLVQVMSKVNSSGSIDTWDGTGYPIGNALSEHIPEFQNVVRVSGNRSVAISMDNNSYDLDIVGADNGFFKMFSIPIQRGVALNGLSEKNSIVLSESMAKTYFGEESAVGKTIELTLDVTPELYNIIGVFKDIPRKSTLQFDAAISLDALLPYNNKSWGNTWVKTYALVVPNVSFDDVSHKVKDIPAKWGNSEWFTLALQPFQDRYLYDKFENGQVVGGRIDYLILFAIIAGLTLLIACFNFINLATAWAIKRTKEVGIKKVLGAGRGSLVLQFLIESILLVGFALAVGVLFTLSMLPWFNGITGKDLTLDFNDIWIYPILLIIAGITILLSGGYPAWFLSSFKPVKALKGRLGQQIGQATLRKGLVVVQFAITVFLVAGALIVYLQLRYVTHKNLGFDKDSIVYVPMNLETWENRTTIQNELGKYPSILEVGLGSNDFVNVGGTTGDPQWEGKSPDNSPWFNIMTVDYNLLPMLDIKTIEGRSFSKDLVTDSLNYIVNQAALRAMDLEDPIGRSLSFWGDKGRIQGVVDDFHSSTLHNAIGPMIIRCRPSETSIFFIKAAKGKMTDALADLSGTIKQFSDIPMEYHFLDRALEKGYQSDRRVQQLATVFGILALIISCLGLIGLATFSANQRIREIAVRKVLGASVSSLFRLLSNDYFKLIFLALVIAIPAAWVMSKKWLETFAYHMEVHWWMFVISAALVAIIALMAIGQQLLRASMSNPVKSLRAE